MQSDVERGKPPLVIWHKGCLDGFTSAWIVWRFSRQFGIDPEFHAGVYQDANIPDTTDRNVIMVDFSYPAPVIELMTRNARSVLILDHHKTAEADLRKWIVPFTLLPPEPGQCKAIFDQSLSGAGLCWKFFFADVPVPKLVEHVQDRDLWRKELYGTDAICTALYAEDFDFMLWESYMDALEDPVHWNAAYANGDAILRARAKDRVELKTIARKMTIGGWPMPVVNAPWFYASELGNDLASAAAGKVAATYHDEDGKRKFSLRSIPGGPDVSEIAKKFGGGGHARAAGFVAPFPNWSGDQT